MTGRHNHRVTLGAQPFGLSFPVLVAAVFVGYYLAARLGMALAFKPDFISALWPANCVLLTALLVTEPRRWPWFLVATLPAELLADLPAGLTIPDSLQFLAGDWLESALAALAIRACSGRRCPLSDLKGAGCFALFAVLLAPLAAGFAMALATGTAEVPFLLRWRRWFLGDALAHATVTPFLLSLFSGVPLFKARIPWPRLLEGLLLCAAIGTLAAFSFGALDVESSSEHVWTLATLGLLIYSAVRFRTRTTFFASSVLAIAAVWTAAHMSDTAHYPSVDARIADLQVSLLLGVLPIMLLATLIEERRATIATLASDEHRLESILDSLGVGVLAIESSGGAIIYANPAVAHMSGHAAENLIGLKLANLLPLQPPDAVRLLPGAQELSAAGGHRVPVLVTQTETRLRGRTCVLAGLTDLTRYREAEQERARLENDLRQAAKMESVGRLAGGVAHDFNNILQLIGGHLSLAEDALPPDTPARAHLQKIGAANSHASQLIRQLLAFSQQHAIRTTEVDLNQLLRDLAEMLKPILGESIVLRVELGADVPPLLADAHLLEQLVFNLCTNAREAMPAGGRLLLRSACTTLTHDDLRGERDAAPGTFARILVCDTGKGMDAETAAHIFEPFFTTKENGAGAGLGLATVYGIVKQHGGLIRVESEPGIGTTFCVYLPAQAAAATPPPAPALAHRPATILLAEDNAGVRELEASILRHAGYQVHAAADGDEAFDLFRRYSREVDLLLFDVVMPRRGGLEAAELIRREAPDIPVLFTSGYSEELTRDAGATRPGFHFLPKPHSRDELLRAVRGALDGTAGAGA
jgi:PAS domain S-box-containing protein